MIFIFRHSFAESHSQNDHSRNLTGEGIQLAKERAEALCNASFSKVVSSTAHRAFQTAQYFSAAKDTPLITDASLYLAPLALLKNKILDVSNSDTLFVGHNPGISQLLSTIDPQYMTSIPPCCGVAIESSGDHWKVVRTWGVTT